MRNVLLVIAIAACGSDSSTKKMDAAVHNDSKLVDAKPIDAGIDAPPDAPSGIVRVTCPSGAHLTVTIDTTSITPKYVFTPNTQSINQNDIVEFVTTATHDVFPDTGVDPGIHVPFSQDACRQFTAKGTFGFHCSIHQFTGSLTVN